MPFDRPHESRDVEPQPTGGTSYRQILKSSALIGGSSVLVIAIGIVRTKIMAILLGPAGFGLMGMYTAIVDLAVSVAGLGVSSSGVRQIAEAVGTGETSRIARTVYVLRRISAVLGLFGAAALIVFSRQVSEVAFGNAQYQVAVTLLSVAVLFRLIAAGHGAVLQGTRRIRDLALMGVLGALFGTALSVPLVYTFGQRGVAPSVVAATAIAMFMAWMYGRRVAIGTVSIDRASLRAETTALLKLGVAFMASGLLMMGAAFAVRTLVLRIEGLDAAGLYHSAWTLGGLYIGIVLQAMGADFYPRLTGAIGDSVEANRLVNEQATVSLLLAGPGVIGTLTLAPVLMVGFYSEEFTGATELLRWLCMGMALRVITWPMGFIIIARGEKVTFFATEAAWAIVNVSLAWICLERFGLRGAGVAFFAAYILHAMMIYPIVRRLTGFRWTDQSGRIVLWFVASIAAVFVGFLCLPTLLATVLGVSVLLVSVGISIRAILQLVDSMEFPKQLRTAIKMLRLSRARIERL